MSMSRGPPGGGTLRSMLAGRDPGVSEVVGAAILVGIAVVLATVIATFVFGLAPGGGPQKPNAQVDIDRPQPTVSTGWDPVGVYRTNVIQVRIRHAGGDNLQRDSINARITARSTNMTANGYLLHYNSSDRVNKTEPHWNLLEDATIETGDKVEYELFATNELGEDDGVISQASEPQDIWQRGECRVEEFSNNRGGEGAINISGGANASVDCPFSGGNATILGGDVSEGGRIAEGDTVHITWSPPGAVKSTRLREYDV